MSFNFDSEHDLQKVPKLTSPLSKFEKFLIEDQDDIFWVNGSNSFYKSQNSTNQTIKKQTRVFQNDGKCKSNKQ